MTEQLKLSYTVDDKTYSVSLKCEEMKPDEVIEWLNNFALQGVGFREDISADKLYEEFLKKA